jgi:GT2 family glycosyltransferase
LAPRASIVVIAAKDGPLLRHCIELLTSLPDETEFETIVVLNRCPPEVAQRIRDETDAVEVLSSEVNLGLAGALNYARDSVCGEFMVSIHDDVEPSPGWLDALVRAADDEPGAGAVGSLILNADGSVQGAGWELLANLSNRPAWRDEPPPPPAAFTARRAVDYAQSASLLIRTSTFDQIGGADERLFPFCHVDLDLCLAMRASGQQVLCEPASVLTHKRGSSSTRDFAIFVCERNRHTLLRKWADLLSAHPGTEPGSGVTWSLPRESLPVPERATDASARERAQLIRHVETLDAYVGHLVAELDRRANEFTEAEAGLSAIRHELEAAGAQLEAVQAQLEASHAEHAATQTQHAATQAQHAATQAQLDATQSQLPWLVMRAETLARIEAGGWWRLRSRLRPLLRLASAARRALRRR